MITPIHHVITMVTSHCMITHNTYLNRMADDYNNMLVARDDSAMNTLYNTKFWREKILANYK